MTMRPVSDAFEIVESLNDEAHECTWESWVEADELEDWEEAEAIREDVSEDQTELFRTFFHELSEEDRDVVIYWLKKDNVLKEQFSMYYGEYHFKQDFLQGEE